MRLVSRCGSPSLVHTAAASRATRSRASSARRSPTTSRISSSITTAHPDELWDGMTAQPGETSLPPNITKDNFKAYLETPEGKTWMMQRHGQARSGTEQGIEQCVQKAANAGQMPARREDARRRRLRQTELIARRRRRLRQAKLIARTSYACDKPRESTLRSTHGRRTAACRARAASARSLAQLRAQLDNVRLHAAPTMRARLRCPACGNARLAHAMKVLDAATATHAR